MAATDAAPVAEMMAQYQRAQTAMQQQQIEQLQLQLEQLTLQQLLKHQRQQQSIKANISRSYVTC